MAFSGFMVLGLLTGCGVQRVSSSVAPGPEALRYQQGVETRNHTVQINLGRAISSEESAILQDPTWAPAYVRLAGLFWNADQPRSALATMKKACSLDPSSTNERRLGQMAQAMQQPKIAVQAYRSALARNPGDWMAWDGLAGIAVDQKQWTTALNDVRQSLLVGGPQGVTFDLWGRIEQHQGRWRQAAIDYRNAEAASPGWWRSYYDLAQVEIHWGATVTAENLLRQGLQANPSNGKIWRLLETLPQTTPVPAHGT